MLEEQLQKDYFQAMKDRDTVKASTVNFCGRNSRTSVSRSGVKLWRTRMSSWSSKSRSNSARTRSNSTKKADAKIWPIRKLPKWRS